MQLCYHTTFIMFSFLLVFITILIFFFFFFNDTATTEIYTLSLHDALPIYAGGPRRFGAGARDERELRQISRPDRAEQRDRKSTRLNSSHGYISYAVFCLKKKKKHHNTIIRAYDIHIKWSREVPTADCNCRT